ncbi:MAG: hypothetical protein GX624_10880 [Actinobacteria bacterium]|nr:hypothetical protein [Actinomycetota bacterium]
MGGPTTTSSPGRRARRGRGARLMLATGAALLLTLLFAATAEAAKSGKLLYAKRIGGTSTTEAGAYAVAAGPKGVTALAGAQGKSGIFHPMVAKYTGAGKRVWLKRYTVVDQGSADDVAFDRRGNVYVAATVYSGATPDIVVLKYSASGTLLWATKPYDGGEQDYDGAVKLAVDAKGDVVVLGQSAHVGGMGIVVLKYKKKSGKPAWAEPTRWVSPQDIFWAADLALDGEGDIYVACSTSSGGFSRALIWKARGSDGQKSGGWHYVPRHGDSSSFHALTVRGSSVVATGSAWTKGVDDSTNALVAKYDRGLQEKAWKEWGVGNKSEEWFNAAVIDAKGSVFLTGRQWVEGEYSKAVTMKLNAKLKTVWSKTYMPASKYALGWYIARDGAGDIYVGGYEGFSAVQPPKSLLTIKYSAAGARKWARAWTPGSGGSVDGEHGPAGLVLGSKDGVYIGGRAKSKGGGGQAVLLKYRR